MELLPFVCIRFLEKPEVYFNPNSRSHSIQNLYENAKYSTSRGEANAYWLPLKITTIAVYFWHCIKFLAKKATKYCAAALVMGMKSHSD